MPKPTQLYNLVSHSMTSTFCADPALSNGPIVLINILADSLNYGYNGRPWRRSSWGKEDLSASCCWQLQDCADIDERDYDYFNCDDDKDLTITIASDDLALDVVLQTCDALKDALATALSLEHLIPDGDLRR